MTLGRDVSSYFPDVVKNVVVESTEVKKLVYMYVIHYSTQNPELALLSINSFQRGST
jgi:AP-3 complex subunit beta